MNWLKVGVAVGLLVALTLAVLGIHHHGYTEGYEAAQSKQRDDTQKAKTEQEALATKRLRDATLNLERTQDALDKVAADKLAADQQSDGLREESARRIARLQSSLNSCSATASATIAKTVRVYADLFEKAERLSGVLATTADQAIERGVSCERQYDSLRVTP